MLKLMQILKWMKMQGMSLNQVLDELHDIVDNNTSQYFELTDSDVLKISKIFYDEKKFDSALKVAGYGNDPIINRKNPNKQEAVVWYAVLAGFLFLIYKLKKEHKNYSIDLVNKTTTQASAAGVRG